MHVLKNYYLAALTLELTSSSDSFFGGVWGRGGRTFPLSSQRKHICKENEPPKEIPLAWYFFFFKQNLLGRVSTPLLLHTSSNRKPVSLMRKWQYTVFQDTESVRAVNQPTHPPTNTCTVSTTVQAPWEQGRGGPHLHGQKCTQQV